MAPHVFIGALQKLGNLRQRLSSEDAIRLLQRYLNSPQLKSAIQAKLGQPCDEAFLVQYNAEPIFSPSESFLPPDGYTWRDAETVQRITLAGVEIELISRGQGCRLATDSTPVVTKLLFRIIGSPAPVALLIYYSLSPMPSVSAVPPTASTATVSAPSGKGAHGHRIGRPPKVTQVNQQSIDSQRLVDAPERLHGDELDCLTARDIASARYKRNHIFMEDLFSPLSTTDLLTASRAVHPADNHQELRKLLRQRKETLDQKMQTLRAKQEARIKEIRESSRELMSQYAALCKTTKLEEITEAEKRITKALGVKLMPAESKMFVRIAGDKPAQSETAMEL